MMFEVGKTYLLPTTELLIDGLLVTVVIMHDHVGDISGERHQHVDMQFLPEEALHIVRGKINEDIFACAPHDVVMREVVCQRPFQHIKSYRSESRDKFLEVQRRCQDRVMADNICPHQGCDLSHTPPIRAANGKEVLVCPCHGLRWSTETGELVPRIPRKTPG